MRKKILGFFLICLLVTPLAFAQSAIEVAFGLKVKGLDFIYPFDEKTDPNEQLGRPNQYIEKVSWPDPLIDPKFESDGYYDSDIDPILFKGGTLEKFKNLADRDRRYNYVKSVHLSDPTTNQYMYKKGLFLLRLDKTFTPTQAKEYEKKFNQVVK
ncbi:hypothetical protein F4V57_03830 [Acinetobacter qingfengensis]|uniref:Uncharacterized protein n=1 Tax=Acinetobacter qingfengensis TaxID=1262585 RepID=A0A1E7RCB1_9GAMM|nr:hypothetical protein [Acinetobacter qingfengensis]KAA8734898.1 hypothetical protein F4V57_03830 [Acinetobacter qingfengensis]OEY96933.1 hypothetical protein BJI46_11665 [Acinetobacter qingfengensis]